jgi:hypothetical protein
MIYITIKFRVYNFLDGIKACALELHHGFTTQGQPWRLGHVLGNLVGNSRTCDACWFPPVLLLRVSGSLMNGWMWRSSEADTIYRGAPRSKGVANRAQNRPGRPAQARYSPVSLPDASRSIIDLPPCACGPLTSCSSCVLTCAGLHDLLLKCLMNLSRKSPL